MRACLMVRRLFSPSGLVLTLKSLVTLDDMLVMLGGPVYSNVLKTALEQRMPGTGNWFLDSKEFNLLVKGNIAILWGMGLRTSSPLRSPRC